MINYKVSKCKNPGKNAVEGTTYYSCKASKTSDYTFKELAQDIAYSTTCTKAWPCSRASSPSCRTRCSAVAA